MVEAKRGSRLGRCSRYGRKSCPAVHQVEPVLRECRYWDEPAAVFADELDLPEPTAESNPICNQHYQLARTLMVGRYLSRQLDLSLHLWLLVPQRGWRRLQADWLDFTDRLLDSDLWRRMRVLSWEALKSLPA